MECVKCFKDLEFHDSASSGFWKEEKKRKEVIFHGVVTDADGFTRHWAKGDLPVVFMGKAEHSPLGIRVVPFRHWIQMQAKQAHLFLLASSCLFRSARSQTRCFKD